MANLPPKPVLAAPMPTIQTHRPSDDDQDARNRFLQQQQQQQIIHPSNPQSHPHLPSHNAIPAPPLFSGSSALDGTDLDDDFDHAMQHAALVSAEESATEAELPLQATTNTLAPPHHAGNRRSPSPRATSPSVGTIGGHRSPALGASAASDNPSSPFAAPFAPSLQQFGRQSSEDSLTFQSIRSASPRAASPLSNNGFPSSQIRGQTASPAHFHAFRSSSPSFASALSHHSNNGRMSPMRNNDRHTPSLSQVMGDHRRMHSGSPAASDRPASRLDTTRLQQRQNSANAQKQNQVGQQQQGNNFPPQVDPHTGTWALNLGNQSSGPPPQLVQPRPELPVRTYSEGSMAGSVVSPAPEQFSPPTTGPGYPNPTESNLVSSLASMTVKPDGYPFPIPHPAAPVNRASQNSSRQSFRGNGGPGPPGARVGSPMDLNRMRQWSAATGSDQPLLQQQRQSQQQQQQQSQQQQQQSQQQQQQSQQQQQQSQQQQQQQNHLAPIPEQRLTNVEAALEELNKGLTSVAHSVGWLIEREKARERKGSNNSNSSRGGRSVSGGGAGGSGGSNVTPAMRTASPSEISQQPNEEIKVLGQQVSVLSQSVQQLMALQQNQQQQSRRGPNNHQGQRQHNTSALIGGNGPVQSRLHNAVNAPPPFAGPPAQMGPPSPNFAPPPPAATGAANAMTSPLLPATVDYRGVSPQPGAMGPNARQGWPVSPHLDPAQAVDGNGGSNRRWSMLPPGSGPLADPNARRESLAAPGSFGMPAPGTPELAPAMRGAMPPPDANVTATKWEHLNLQPDLLRSVLKYGLGPPNKIQQRALPFLLRGSDIIAQAPPTQERIASYVIPALQCVLNTLRSGPPPLSAATGSAAPQPEAGPLVLILSTTVDQATQAQRMALGLGSSLGVRVHIAAGAGGDAAVDAQGILQHRPHIVVGTPAKMSEVMTKLATAGPSVGVNLADVKMVVLDEVDQMIARNLSDHVGTLLRVLPPVNASLHLQGNSPAVSPGLPPQSSNQGFNPFESGTRSPVGERQMAIFSNTVPQDVLNFAQSIHLRESVRVLVRREGTSVTQHPPPGSAGTAAGGGGRAAPGHEGLPSQQQIYAASRQQGQVAAPGESSFQSLKALRQYYLYIAVPETRSSLMNGSNFGSVGGEMKLDVITDLLEDMEFNQAVIYTGSTGALEAVTYKLASRGIEALALHCDMAPHIRQQVLTRFRTPSRGQRKALVSFDLPINAREVHQIPLVVFYDLPRSFEEYRDKISCAISGAGRASVCIHVVTGGGSNVEVLKGLESSIGVKIAELPIDAKGILNE
ncbi:unnamed protein product [Sympodiomycopsis kandeliae]